MKNISNPSESIVFRDGAGWVSESGKNVSLRLELPQAAYVHKVQILFHETYKPKQIEIQTKESPGKEFKVLGYVKTQTGSPPSRELKSVYLKTICSEVLLGLKDCNTKASVILVNVLGTPRAQEEKPSPVPVPVPAPAPSQSRMSNKLSIPEEEEEYPPPGEAFPKDGRTAEERPCGR